MICLLLILLALTVMIIIIIIIGIGILIIVVTYTNVLISYWAILVAIDRTANPSQSIFLGISLNLGK